MHKFRKIKHKPIDFHWYDKSFQQNQNVTMPMKSMSHAVLEKYKRKCHKLLENLQYCFSSTLSVTAKKKIR